MKPILSLAAAAAVLIAASLTSASAQTANVNPAALLGRWQATAPHPSGATVTSTVQLDQNLRFTTSSTVDGTPFLDASGTWKLSGKTLEWRYEQSSHPAIQKGFVDVDSVESVSPNQIELVSRGSGKRHVFRRVP
jgi:hypothetical protein